MRTIRHGALVAVLLGLAAMPAAAGAQTAAVAHRMDAAHSGSTDAGPAPPLRQRWTRALEPEENPYPELSYPLVVDGRVFIVAARTLHALSAQTGATLWSRPVSVGTPAYDGGHVIVTTGSGVQAFDAATGAPRWSRDLETRDCPAVATGGVVYTISGWTAHALRVSDGSTLWSRALTEGCEATVGGDLVSYSGSGTTALRRADGTVAWTSATGGRTAALHGGRLWTGDGSSATALDATTGASAGGAQSWRMPAFGGGHAFVSVGQSHSDPQARMLQAVDPATGAVRWEFAAERGIATTPTVAGGTVYVADMRRGLYGLRASDGARSWCTTMPEFPDRSTHVVAGEGLLVVTAGHSVTVFEPGGAPGCDYRRVARPHWADPIGSETEPYATPPSVSTYLGGWMHDEIVDVDVDATGAVYVTGWTQSRDFAATGWHEWNAMCESDTCTDAFVAKYAPGGRSLVYRRLLGGDGNERGTAIAVDSAGRAHVAGDDGDVFVARLSPDGSAVQWSSALGGWDGDSTASDITLDASGNAYVTGHTTAHEFPTTAGAADRECVDDIYTPHCGEAFVTRFTPAGAVAFSTMFGGSDADEHGTGIALDRAGRIVIAGLARHATDFPATAGAYDTTPHGSASEAFAARLSADGSAVQWATTFGGDDWDDALGLALDAQDRPVIVGATNSFDFPTTPGAHDRLCEVSGGRDQCSDQGDTFVTKLAGDGSALEWSTFVGGAGDDVARAVALGTGGDVLIAGGTTAEFGFPFKDAFQSVEYNGPGCGSWSFCGDAFVVRLGETGALEYGTFMGGDSEDYATGIAVDPQGDAWVGGLAHSQNFPVSADAVQPEPAGGNCGGAVLLFLECADGFLAEIPAGATTPADPPAEPDAPPVDAPPAAIVSASGPAATTTTAAGRRLTVRRRGRVLTGRVRADTAGCAARVRVVLERRAGGSWRAVARARTAADGRYRLRLPGRRGTYRVRAPGGTACAPAAASPTAR